jgi:hypothetical protein
MELTPPSVTDGDDSALELRRNRFGSQEVTIDEVRISGADAGAISELSVGEPLVVTLVLRGHAGPVHGAAAAVSIFRTSDGVVCCDSNTETDGVSLGRLESETTVTLRYDRLDLPRSLHDRSRRVRTGLGVRIRPPHAGMTYT